MRILVTNDDGVSAPGLGSLERVARKLSDDVWVVAPETDHSGLSHSLTLSDPLRLRDFGNQRFSLRGTPSDCVIMAVRTILGGRPDLVLSGINNGQNAADDVTYSGTVAGAIEGTLLGIPSIALSQASDWENASEPFWETAETFAPNLIARILKFGFSAGVLYNINFPDCRPDAVKGIEVTAQGRVTHSLFIDERKDVRGMPYYWLQYRKQAIDLNPGTDLHAIENDVVSVTPLRLDLTDYPMVEKLKAALAVENG
ncbi:MAG: 5'/3'-nucleotidase SurE [Bauldia sp.]|nr:5'/3'-nucleotidase SurE [Bauldia sp.]